MFEFLLVENYIWSQNWIILNFHALIYFFNLNFYIKVSYFLFDLIILGI